MEIICWKYKLVKDFSFLLCLFLFQFSYAQSGQNILYGEHPNLKEAPPNTSRIFYDRNGDLYPDYLISDPELNQAEGALTSYFKTHPADFQRVAQQYISIDSNYSEVNFDRLQDSILHQKIREINQRSKYAKTVHFLVHGFRKPFKRQGRSSSSVQDYHTLKNAILSGTENPDDHYFVEIYWDGMYDCCFSKNIFKNKKLFRLFKNEARKNAVMTGYQLRKLISAVQKEKVSLISHSLGARVLTTCLFNAFPEQIPENWLTLPTPSQKRINISMIAPAISRKPFKFYHHRVTSLDYNQQDNYRLFILYNETDFVLRKKYKGLGPGPKKHGRTTLGCNHKQECFKLEKSFKNHYPASEIKLSQATTVGICHLVRCYTNSENFVALKEFIKP